MITILYFLLKIRPTFKNSIGDAAIKEWIKETEVRCSVTDNIK